MSDLFAHPMGDRRLGFDAFAHTGSNILARSAAPAFVMEHNA